MSAFTGVLALRCRLGCAGCSHSCENAFCKIGMLLQTVARLSNFLLDYTVNLLKPKFSVIIAKLRYARSTFSLLHLFFNPTTAYLLYRPVAGEYL